MGDPLAKLPRWLGPRAEFFIRCALFALDDLRKELRYRTGNITADTGTRHVELSLAESVAYIEGVFADYKRDAGIERFHGRVAEVGPGDNSGVACLFLADGCGQVDLVDRFYSRRDAERQAAIYRSLMDAHPALQRRFAGVDLRDEGAFPGVARHYGTSAAVERYFRTHRGYHWIVSRAVLEHAVRPLDGLRQMAAALAPGGRMVHGVDLGDHEMFSTRFHELKFLEVPDRLYRRMVRASGRPNRVRIHEYRAELDRLGLEFSLLVTRLAAIGDVTPAVEYREIPGSQRAQSSAFVAGIRDRLCRSLREASDEDLSVTAFTIVASNGRAKPGT